MRPFGYHISGGQFIGSELRSTVQAGFTAAQIFLGPPKFMSFKRPPEVEVSLFKHIKETSGIKAYVHAPYVLHAFAKPENKIKNDNCVYQALKFADELGCDGYVLHMGGTKWYEETQQLPIALELFDLLKKDAIACPILFENCASGPPLSGDLSKITDLISQLQSHDCKVGLCLDTLHAWAFGYDYCKLEDFQRLTDWSVLSKLQLIHLNSGPETVSCGSNYDRHAGLMDGIIPVQFFIDFLKAVPGISVISERDNYHSIMNEASFVSTVDKEHALLSLNAPTI